MPEIKVRDIHFLNILPEEAIKKISVTQNYELNFINYTPNDIAAKLGFKGLMPTNSNYSDLLITGIFANSKERILRLLTKKINFLERFYLAIKSLFVVNSVLLIILTILIINLLFHNYLIDRKISVITKDQADAEKLFQSTQNMILDTGEIANFQVGEVVDFGKINEVLEKNNIDLFQIIGKFFPIKNNEIKITTINYKITNYEKAFNSAPQIDILVSGQISSTNGDPEELIKKFDGLMSDIKNNFKEYDVIYSELPRDLDLSKKYFAFPFNLTIKTSVSNSVTNAG